VGLLQQRRQLPKDIRLLQSKQLGHRNQDQTRITTCELENFTVASQSKLSD